MTSATTKSTPPLMPRSNTERGAALFAQFRAELNQDSTLDPTLDVSRDLAQENNHYDGLLRVQEKAMEALETENTELKLQVYQLRRERDDAERRLSGQPVQHGFYEFDEERRRSNRRGSHTVDLTETLEMREALAKLQREHTMLELEVKKERRAAENIAARAEQKHKQMVQVRKKNEELAKQLELALSEQMMTKADKNVLRDAANHAESKLGVVEDKLRDAEKRAAVLEETVGRVNELVEKERRRVAEADKRVDRMREAVSLLETSARRAEIRQQEHVDSAKKAHAESVAAQKALVAERRRNEELEVELCVTTERLNEERKRADVENAAREHTCKNHAGKGQCPDAFRLPPLAQLEQLVGNFNVSTDFVSLSHDNLKKWRDTVLTEINESLTMLYCFQRQVEKQRDSFVEEYTRRASTEMLQEKSTNSENLALNMTKENGMQVAISTT